MNIYWIGRIICNNLESYISYILNVWMFKYYSYFVILLYFQSYISSLILIWFQNLVHAKRNIFYIRMMTNHENCAIYYKQLLYKEHKDRITRNHATRSIYYKQYLWIMSRRYIYKILIIFHEIDQTLIPLHENQKWYLFRILFKHWFISMILLKYWPL